MIVTRLHRLRACFVSSPDCAAKAQAYEKASLQGIQQLVHRSYQTLALWKLVSDHQFSKIIAELPKVRVFTFPPSLIR